MSALEYFFRNKYKITYFFLIKIASLYLKLKNCYYVIYNY